MNNEEKSILPTFSGVSFVKDENNSLDLESLLVPSCLLGISSSSERFGESIGVKKVFI